MSMPRYTAGDVVPFDGTQEQAEENINSHDWERKPSDFLPSIPAQWAEKTNIHKFPDFIFICSRCQVKMNSEASKYRCGDTVPVIPEGRYMSQGGGSMRYIFPA